jgi:putative transposase
MVKNHHLAKSIMDAAWGKLMRYTAYKVENTGGQVYYIDPYGTTQICSRCGEWIQKSLKVRVHTCHMCGNSMDRDLNAALNILKRIGWDTPESRVTPAEIAPLQCQNGHCTHGR